MARVETSRILFVDNMPRPLGWFTEAGFLRDSQGTGAHGPRVFGKYALVLLLSGGGFYRDTRGNHATVGPGKALLIFPELAHTYGPIRSASGNQQSHWDELFVAFQGPIFDLWRSEGLLDDRTPVWNVPDVDATAQHLQELVTAPRPANTRENLVLLHQFLALLGELTPSMDTEVDEPVWLSATRASLRSDLEQKLSLEKLGRNVGFSAEALRKAFTRAMGVSPAQYRAQARLEAAKLLLQRGDLTHATIAQSLGFKDEGHFSRRFKALEGISPRNWKTNQQPEGM